MKKITLIFMLFISAAGFAQLPLEGFEGTWTPLTGTAGPAGPTGWYIKNVAGPAQTWNQATNGSATPVTFGTHAAYLNRETVAPATVTEDWLITPQFTVPNNAQLKFQSRLTQNNDQGSNYKVMIGTDPTNASTFTDLQTWTELTLNTVQLEYQEKVVNIPAANVGLPRYIAFVMTGNNGDRWLVDEVQVVEQCFIPTALAANPSGTSAILSWTGSATNYEIEVVPFANNFTDVGVATSGATYTTPATLTPSTAYKYQVRAICAPGNYSAWAGPFEFSTSQIAGTLNFTDGFEGALEWSFVNGTQTNQWVYGTATANGGTHSLYISNDGTNNTYTTAPASATSVVQVYRDIQMPPTVDQFSLSFDWKGQGESCCDYLRVWLAPVSFTPTAGTQITANPATGLVQIGGNFNIHGNWQTVTNTINAGDYSGTVRRLIFEWINDFSVGTQPPAAIDNINLTLITCPAPVNLALNGITQNSATVGWTGPTSVSPTFDFYFSQNATAPTPGTTPTSNVTSPTVTLPGLSPSTTYYFWVRSNCSSSDKSTWTGPLSFTTSVINDNFDGAIALSVNSDANCTLTTTTAFTSTTSSALALPTCSTYTTNGPDIWYEFTATNSTQTLALSNFGGTAQPVVISVYEGIPANGGELFCSANNAVNMVGLTPGTTYLVRLTLNPSSTTINLNTTFNICVSTPSNDADTNCEITTINPSFELPNMAHTNSGQGPDFFNDNVVQGWRTGANDHIMEYWIEPNYEHQPAYHTNTGTDLFVNWPASPSANSDQFIELNANANQGSTMGVYQDYVAAPGTVFVVKFAHRARNTNYASASYASSGNVIDVMRLMAGPVPAPGQTLAELINNNSYTQVGTNFSTSANGVPSGYPGISGASVANGGNGTAWAYYGADGSLTYTVPPGQTSTRFFFQAVSTSTPNTSVGNFLDAITFTANNAITSTNPAVADCDPTTTTIFNYVDVSATGGGTWTAHADNPSATTIANPTANSTTISGFTVPGTYLYDWTTAYCTNLLTVTYTAPDIDTPTAQTAYTYCEGATATALTATPLAGYTLNWYTAATGGTATTTAPTPDTSVPGTTTYYLSQSSTAGACESPRLEITVTVNEVPDAPVTADVSYCQNAVATELTATATTTNTLNWYTVPTGGTALAAAPTPGTSVVGTTPYYVSQTTPEGCESSRATINVTVTAPATQVTAFTLPASVCIAGTNPVATLGGTTITGGTFTSSDAGLVIDATTGEIDLAQSTAGAYQVTYTVAGDVATCVALSSSTQPITITPLSAPVTGFQYPALCISAANQLPVLDPGFSTGGTFTSSDPALVIDPATGEINLAASTAGSYTVTVTFTQDGVNCTAAATNTAPVTITPLATPVTGFSYAATCGLATTLNPALDTNFATGGTFTADAGVSINAATGVIDVANTTPGNYNVTYTLAQNNAACVAGATVTVPVTITTPAVPVVSFTYTDVCASAANQLPVLTTGFQAGGTFSAPTGLFINGTTGEINTAASVPGTYIVTYSFAADPVNCIAANSGTFTVNITPVITPVTGFEYDPAYCFGTTSVTPVLDTNFYTGGTFSVTGGLTINPATGEITNLATAAPGSYTVTYTVPADAATCNMGGTDTFTFTINTEITFEITGECNGAAYVLTAMPTNTSYDPELVLYQWSTAGGTPVGTDSAEFNVTDYVNSTSAIEAFPMDFVLTVTSNGCDEPLTYTVEDISCEIQRGISPGGSEGMNDYFDLASLGVKKLTIFNRYGEEVYAKNNYTIEWVGQTDKGQELPTGTYFYVIDRNAGETKTGWIYINRQN
ncbi:gliding motility-associated C-terminal domain-containing protein [Flavobacterium sp. RHBU_24]|uniref:Ig-like domain-containing protein n=1 Tax=Flavobacterium sp. RHBU_24 TaxID=3391185 RepID=UPI0039848DEA